MAHFGANACVLTMKKIFFKSNTIHCQNKMCKNVTFGVQQLVTLKGTMLCITSTLEYQYVLLRYHYDPFRRI